jgi:hypothetical protein
MQKMEALTRCTCSSGCAGCSDCDMVSDLTGSAHSTAGGSAQTTIFVFRCLSHDCFRHRCNPGPHQHEEARVIQHDVSYVAFQREWANVPACSTYYDAF